MSTIHKIQTIGNVPDYINAFIKFQRDSLEEIRIKSEEEMGPGCLTLRCSQEKNIMDVIYLDDENMKTLFENWMTLSQNIPKNKVLYIVQDLDLNSVFLLYI